MAMFSKSCLGPSPTRRTRCTMIANSGRRRAGFAYTNTPLLKDGAGVGSIRNLGWKPRKDDMSENVSRRGALSVLRAALGLALAPTEYEAEAETAGIGRRQHRRADRRHRRTGPPATAPAEAPDGA